MNWNLSESLINIPCLFGSHLERKQFQEFLKKEHHMYCLTCGFCAELNVHLPIYFWIVFQKSHLPSYLLEGVWKKASSFSRNSCSACMTCGCVWCVCAMCLVSVCGVYVYKTEQMKQEGTFAVVQLLVVWLVTLQDRSTGQEKLSQLLPIQWPFPP